MNDMVVASHIPTLLNLNLHDLISQSSLTFLLSLGKQENGIQYVRSNQEGIRFCPGTKACLPCGKLFLSTAVYLLLSNLLNHL